MYIIFGFHCHCDFEIVSFIPILLKPVSQKAFVISDIDVFFISFDLSKYKEEL